MTTTTKLTTKDAIRYLSLLDPDLSNEQIQDRLEWLELDSCSTFVIAQTKASFLSDLRFLEKAGLLRDRRALIPSRIRRLKPRKPPPVRDFYYQ